MKRSKKYLKAQKLVNPSKKYLMEDALKLLPNISISKFPGSIELSLKLKLNEKQKKESIKGSYILPNKFGKTIKVLLFADASYKSKNSLADTIGGEELVSKVEKNELEFDAVVAMPALMPKIAKLGKQLGVKGLMPNPKNGTVTSDPDKTIEKLKSGQKNYKVSSDGIVKFVIGKTDMDLKLVKENFASISQQMKPVITKLGADSLQKVTLSPTMGPSIQIDLKELN